MIVDALQYANWSETVFRQMREGGVAAVHVTICYHETFRETVAEISRWNALFQAHADLIAQAGSGRDMDRIAASGRTAIVFGAQNPSCMEDDFGLVEVLHRLGLRFMQLTYNNQSLLGAGCYEAEDAGLTRMGREVVREMNRVGMVVDMSHSAERTTLEAIEASERPIAITHANPSFWHETPRSKSDTVLKALADTGGMLGFSLYPHHLRGGSHCRLVDFCDMVARTAERMGVEAIGIGSDLCQDRPDSAVEWMRTGRWSRAAYFPDAAARPVFPEQPSWFRDNRDFPNIADGLREVGFSQADVDRILGGNWRDFMGDAFGAAHLQGDLATPHSGPDAPHAVPPAMGGHGPVAAAGKA